MSTQPTPELQVESSPAAPAVGLEAAATELARQWAPGPSCHWHGGPGGVRRICRRRNLKPGRALPSPAGRPWRAPGTRTPTAAAEAWSADPLAADHDAGWLPVACAASLSSTLSCAGPGPPERPRRCPSPPTQHAGSCGRRGPPPQQPECRGPEAASPSVTVTVRRRRSGSGRCRKPGLPRRLWTAGNSDRDRGSGGLRHSRRGTAGGGPAPGQPAKGPGVSSADVGCVSRRRQMAGFQLRSWMCCSDQAAAARLNHSMVYNSLTHLRVHCF